MRDESGVKGDSISRNCSAFCGLQWNAKGAVAGLFEHPADKKQFVVQFEANRFGLTFNEFATFCSLLPAPGIATFMDPDKPICAKARMSGKFRGRSQRSHCKR